MTATFDELALDNFARTQLEQVVAIQPFTVRRVVRWADCDPAGVVYSGNLAEYLLSATHLFRRYLFGESWSEVRRELGIDTPAKAVSLVFEGSLWPDDVVDTSLYVGAIRTHTADLIARAVRTDNGSRVFDGRISFICVPANDRRISANIPDALRSALDTARVLSPAPADLLGRVW